MSSCTFADGGALPDQCIDLYFSLIESEIWNDENLFVPNEGLRFDLEMADEGPLQIKLTFMNEEFEEMTFKVEIPMANWLKLMVPRTVYQQTIALYKVQDEFDEDELTKVHNRKPGFDSKKGTGDALITFSVSYGDRIVEEEKVEIELDTKS